MKKVFIIFKWALAIAFLVVLLIFVNDRVAVQDISLNEIIINESADDFINKQIILSYLKMKSVSFDNILISDFPQEEIEDFLESHPLVKETEVYINQKGEIDILIEQKKAIVRIKSDNEDCYLDEFGKRMELSDDYTAKLLVATGAIAVEDYVGIYEFVKKVNRLEFWKAQFTQIHFANNQIFLIPRVGSQKINIGSFDNITDKLDNLYHFYKTVIPKKGWQTYSDINLKFKNQIVCARK